MDHRAKGDLSFQSGLTNQPANGPNETQGLSKAPDTLLEGECQTTPYTGFSSSVSLPAACLTAFSSQSRKARTLGRLRLCSG